VSSGAEPRPVLITQNYGSGRVLVFAGDTTYRWVRNPEGQRMHSQFWRRLIVWLAQQEDQGSSVWVKPDVRRLPTHTELGFRVGLRDKVGAEVPGATFEAEVLGPDNEKTRVPVVRTKEEGAPAQQGRGTFPGGEGPGVYQIVVRGKDPSSGEALAGEARARFLLYEDDLETTRRAADHEFLRKLSQAGDGRFHRIEQLPGFLENLQKQTLPGLHPRVRRWPDWRTSARSPFLVAFFLAFVTVLSAEWFLRRRWGLV
jgi:hypothetical protein